MIYYFRKGRINIPLLYFHRYLRLTPLLVITMLFCMSLMKFLGNGPVWPQITSELNFCDEYWWSTLLNVQNYVNPSKILSLFSFKVLNIQLNLFEIKNFNLKKIKFSVFAPFLVFVRWFPTISDFTCSYLSAIQIKNENDAGTISPDLEWHCWYYSCSNKKRFERIFVSCYFPLFEFKIE